MVTIRNSKFQILNSKPAFTFFEVIISVGILVILSSVVLQSFLVARDRENTRQAGLGLIEQARNAQTQSLTGQIGVSNLGGLSLVGQYLVKDERQTENKRYILTGNQIDSGTAFSPAQIKNYNDILLQKIETYDGNNWTETTSLIIGFQPPRGLVKFYDPNSNGLLGSAKQVKITLFNTKNEEKRVLQINNLGQMTLEKP